MADKKDKKQELTVEELEAHRGKERPDHEEISVLGTHLMEPPESPPAKGFVRPPASGAPST